MKSLALKLAFAFLLGLPFVNLHAQTEKGRLYVGANLSNVRLGLAPRYWQLGMDLEGRFGKFVADNLVIGGRLGLGFAIQRTGGNGFETSGFSVAPGAFGRYYIPVSKRFMPFVELETGVSKGFAVSNGIRYSPTWAYAQASAGAAIFISDKASLDLSLGFRGTTGLDQPTIGTFTGGLQGKVGFSLYLPTGGNKMK
jgi:hypothetical protein